MTKTADELIFIPARTDGATKSGDMPAAPDVQHTIVPIREPIEQPPTLGLSGDMVTGSGSFLPQPEGAIEKVVDSCCELPRSESV
ncbi:MAG TPA: hypothetical protein VIV83_07520 [Gemmatimonadales bacterium]|jgi:hypothetical protein